MAILRRVDFNERDVVLIVCHERTTQCTLNRACPFGRQNAIVISFYVLSF